MALTGEAGKSQEERATGRLPLRKEAIARWLCTLRHLAVELNRSATAHFPAMSQPSTSPAHASRRLQWLSRVTLAVGLGLTLAAWQLSSTRQARVLRTGFESEAHHLAGAFNREIDLFSDVLISLGELHTLSERISARDFEEFARKGLQHQVGILGSFAFAQRISIEVRAVLENAAEPEGLRVVEYGPEGRLQSAGARTDYFPLTYQNPEEALQLPDGFDVGSLPGQAQAIQRMADSGRPTLGAMINNGGRSGFLVGAPIFSEASATSAAPRALTGFTAAVLWPEDQMNRALQRTLVRGVAVTLYDPVANPQVPSGAGLSFETPVNMVDQVWTLRCEAAPAYLSTHSSPVPWIVLGAGLAVTLLLTLQISSLAARTALIEQTVRERTAELSTANRHLAEEMDERLRLEQEIHDVTAREKRRIGEDLHDSLGQKLAGAVYLSRALVGQLPEEQAEARDSAGKINEILKDAVAQVRRTARGLAPVDVDENGLAQGLRRLAEETCDVYNIACSFRAEGPAQVRNAQAATHLYHIAQEAVNNAIRHGQARDIAVVLQTGEREGHLLIEDNGRGLAEGYERGGGAGLRIMRHRAQTIGGRLDLTARPGGGVRVACAFPL